MAQAQQINRSLLGSNFQQQLKQSKSLKSSVLSHFQNMKFSVMNNASFGQLFSFQFIAVFLFSFTFCHSFQQSETDAQGALAMLVAITITTQLCGANINPLVTVANCLKTQNKYRPTLLPIYLLAQLTGAVAGLFWSQFLGRPMQSELILAQGDIWRVILNEGMGVFIFIYFILLLSNPNTTFIENQLTGYMSVIIFYFIARSFAPFAKSTLNPAFTLSLCLQYATKGHWDSFSNCWAWLLGDLIGTITAIYFYQLIYEPIVLELRRIRRNSLQNQIQSDEEINQKQ